jgi:hypothetical protein
MVQTTTLPLNSDLGQSKREVTLIGEVKSRIALPVPNKTLFVKVVERDWSSSHCGYACPPD